jgi:hypothetical protein
VGAKLRGHALRHSQHRVTSPRRHHARHSTNQGAGIFHALASTADEVAVSIDVGIVALVAVTILAVVVPLRRRR